MKCKTMKHGNIGLQCMMLAFIFTVCFSSCKDDKDTTAAPYDPSQPVEYGGGTAHPYFYSECIACECGTY